MSAGCALLASCVSGPLAPTDPVDTDLDSDTDTRTCDGELPDRDAPGWVVFARADFPELDEVGGQVTVSRPEALLQAVLARVDEDCIIAAWRICPHGACEVLWRTAERDLWCPCHGSRFDTDGTLLQGPAVRDLRTFPVDLTPTEIRVYRPI